MELNMRDNLKQCQLLKGKRGLVMGVVNKMSLAWAIAEFAKSQGAELAFTFQGPAVEKRVRPLAEELEVGIVEHCDVTDSDSVKLLFENLKKNWGSIDFIIHAVAYSDKNELKGRFINTSKENFLNSLHISCYSLIEVAKHAEPLMNAGGSILTLTYYGANKVVPNYNVMGVAKAALESSVKYLAADLGEQAIRVNAISAGPMKTLAASGISGFNNMLKLHAESSPLGRNNTLEDIAGSAIYLLSNLAAGVTGEVHYVDSGYNILGMPKKLKDN